MYAVLSRSACAMASNAAFFFMLPMQFSTADAALAARALSRTCCIEIPPSDYGNFFAIITPIASKVTPLYNEAASLWRQTYGFRQFTIVL
jgi:hypothetical protein